MSRKQKSVSAYSKVKKQKNKIVIGIDQSYVDTGIAIGYNGELKNVIDCKPLSTATHTQTRIMLREVLLSVFGKMKELSNHRGCEIVCIIERIRLQSVNHGNDNFINFNYIKGIGALNAVIVDTAAQYGISVYSVDTRSWKSQVIGTSKPLHNPFGFADEKWPTIQWCLNHGYGKYITEEVSLRKKKAVITMDGKRYTYNDNKADAIGITMYGFAANQKLEEEH